MLFQSDSSRRNPDDLMADISSTSMVRPAAISAIIHGVLILVTSVHFIGLCFKYGSLDPKQAIREEKAEAEAAAKAAPPPQKATDSSTDEPAADDGKPDTSGSASGDETPVEGAATGTETPEIIKTLNETSDERPASSKVGFGDPDFIE